MKKTLSIFLLIPFMMILLNSCGSDDKDGKNYDLIFERSDYQVMLNYKYEIAILSGNGSYTITSSDETVATGSFLTLEGLEGFGHISITALKKGKAEITVKDNVTGQQKKLNITVTEAYMNLYVNEYDIEVDIDDSSSATAIENSIKDDILLNYNSVISLLRTEDKKLYIFKWPENVSKGDYLFEGSYDFGIQEDKPCLLLNITDGNEQHNYVFGLEGTSGMNLLTTFFNVDWEGLKTTSERYLLKLSQDVTPVYKDLYPTLESASVTFMSEAYMYHELPLELVK